MIAATAYRTSAGATFDEVKAAHQPSDTVVLDRHGTWLHRIRTDTTVRRGPWIALTDVSPALRAALVASEDRRFYEHSGVDWRAVSAAAWGNLWNTKTRGASTLTMQLAGLVDENLKRGRGGRNLAQKIGQTWAATTLEDHWRKDQILEAYLNMVPFRGELVGIDALSQTLFDKAAQGLDAREAALAVALVRAPNAATAQVVQRACNVLQNLEGTKTPSCEAMDLFVAGALQRRDYAASEGVSPHVAALWLRTNPPSPRPAAVRTTLLAPLQRFAVQTLGTHLRELGDRHVEDGAVLVLDNATGDILAWVGSSGELSRAGEVDGVTALRQPGSTLKPFLYAQALAQRRITAASLLDDSDAQIQTTSGLYIPQNYDRQFKGWVSARTALGASLNVPAVRTLVMVSPDAFQKQLAAYGLPMKESGDFYGYSLALGSAEVSLLHLSNAYRTLANGGQVGPLRLGPTMPAVAQAASGRAVDPRAAFIVSDILSDPMARARTFGTDSVLSTRFWTAVKTGTSKDMRDNWAVGYSQRYTVGVWVGNASGAPMWDVSGTTGAAPIWAAVMNYLHAQRPSRAPKPPAGVVTQTVNFAPSNGTPLEAARSEWFIEGTQQASFAMSPGPQTTSKVARIIAPTQGTILALDPDIPPQAQRLTLRAEGQQLRWRIDGKPLGQGNTVLWSPWPGRHTVQLIGRDSKVLDELRLEVRGAGVDKPYGRH